MKSLKRLTIFSLVSITFTACQIAIPQVTATPGVVPEATSTPTRILILEKWEYTCSGGTLTFMVDWKDRMADEAGYRIFRNGEKLIELPADSTTYTDSLDVSPGESVEYFIQVFGPSGTMNSSVMRAEC